MPETLPPCPGCGQPMPGIGDTIHHCAACALTGPRAVLDALADAARLAAAVGRLGEVGSINVSPAGTAWLATCGPYEAFGATPEAALVALAGEVGE